MIITHLVISHQKPEVLNVECRKDQIKNIRQVFPVQHTSLSVCWRF